MGLIGWVHEDFDGWPSDFWFIDDDEMKLLAPAFAGMRWTFAIGREEMRGVS